MIQQQQAYQQQRQLSTQSRLLLFDNAVYQGGYSDTLKQIMGNGLIYFPKTSNIIICSKFEDGLLSNYALSYNSSQRYLYGSWKLNQLHGTALIHLHKITVIAQFANGEIKNPGKAIVLLDEGKIGVVVQLNERGWSVVQRNQLFCSQHTMCLIEKYQFKTSKVPLCMVSFLNEWVALQKGQSARLRFSNNLYQYGFKGGLTFIFTAQDQLNSLALNQKQLLSQHQPKLSKRSMQSIKNIMHSQVAKQRTAQSGKIYHQRQKTKEYIVVQQLSDPSLEYFKYFQNAFNQTFQKKMRAGLLVNKNYKTHNTTIKEQSMFFSPVFRIDGESKSQQRGKSINENSINLLKQSQFEQVFKSGQKEQNSQLQNLLPAHRLKVIKKQQDQFLQHKLFRQRTTSYSDKTNYQPETLQKQIQLNESNKLIRLFHEQDSQTQTLILQSLKVSPAKSFMTSSPEVRKRRQRIFQNSPQTLIIDNSNSKRQANPPHQQRNHDDDEQQVYRNKKQSIYFTPEQQKTIKAGSNPKTILSQKQKQGEWELQQSKIETEKEEIRNINNTQCSPSKFKAGHLNSIQFAAEKGSIEQKQVTKMAQASKKLNLPIYVIRNSDPQFFAIRKQSQSPSKNYNYLQDDKNGKLVFDYVIH